MTDNTALKAAIAYFKDAVRESDKIMAECSPQLQKELTEQKAHFEVALAVMRRAEPANERLTYGELRAMDGEPVWCTTIGHGGVHAEWCIVRSIYGNLQPMGNQGWFADGGTAMSTLCYGKTWLAYRRKPEGGNGHD